jgi:hypothetical protein
MSAYAANEEARFSFEPITEPSSLISLEEVKRYNNLFPCGLMTSEGKNNSSLLCC